MPIAQAFSALRGNLSWSAAVGLVFLAPLSARAQLYSARVRWQPSADPNVIGYRVYDRPVSGSYGAPQDAGMPPSEADGTLSLVMSGLDVHTAYAFAATAYLADGSESGLSNEITLAARVIACTSDADCLDDDACTTNEHCEGGACVTDPVACLAPGECAQATCDSQTGCSVAPLPDGSVCEAGDPCGGGMCIAGVCNLAPDPVDMTAKTHQLSVHRFVLKSSGRARKLSADASFAATTGLDPTLTGAILEVRDGSGALLYSAAVPGSTFRSSRRRRRAFRYVYVQPRRRASAPDANGLQELTLELDDDAIDVSVTAYDPDLAPAMAQTRLTWVLRLGDRCVRNLDMVCSPSRRRDVSCQ